MDYTKLALQMMENMNLLWKTQHQRQLNEAMQGEKCVLGYLFARNEATLPNEISKEMEISTARTAMVLNNLDKKGFIDREINKEDRRQILVTLTEEGRKIALEYNDEHLHAIKKMLKVLGEHDAIEFVRIIGEIGTIFSEQ